MGWLGRNLTKLAAAIGGAPPVDLVFVPNIPAVGIPGVGEQIEPDKCYIELYLESLRLERARVFATSFNAVVYSFVSLPREGEANAELTAVSKPEKLSNVDPNAINRVITVEKLMMGATAFRGGPVSLEFGLFSVKGGNFLTTMLGYVTKVSEAAGVSFVGAVKPFLPLITEGLDLISGQVNETVLEVGIDTDWNISEGCVAAIISRPKADLDITRLSLDGNDRKLLLDSKPLDCGYAVFSIRRVPQKNDFGVIPELKEKYSAFQAAIRSGKQMEAKDTLTVFRLATIASPDLISADAALIVNKAKAKYDAAFPPGGFAAVGREAIAEESLAEIGLYQ